MKELLKAKSKFRQKGVALKADKVKSGGGGSWKFAGEDNLIKTIQEPLSECGLELIVTMEFLKELSIDTIKATLFHVDSGESISTQISLPPVTPRNDKNGNPMYLDAEIERGKQFGYWSRILSIRILGLSDIDPEDTNNMPLDITDEAKNEIIVKLEAIITKAKNADSIKAWINSAFNVDEYTQLNAKQANEALNSLISQKNANN